MEYQVPFSLFSRYFFKHINFLILKKNQCTEQIFTFGSIFRSEISLLLLSFSKNIVPSENQYTISVLSATPPTFKERNLLVLGRKPTTIVCLEAFKLHQSVLSNSVFATVVFKKHRLFTS